jgi:hypothetical protein
MIRSSAQRERCTRWRAQKKMVSATKSPAGGGGGVGGLGYAETWAGRGRGQRWGPAVRAGSSGPRGRGVRSLEARTRTAHGARRAAARRSRSLTASMLLGHTPPMKPSSRAMNLGGGVGWGVGVGQGSQACAPARALQRGRKLPCLPTNPALGADHHAQKASRGPLPVASPRPPTWRSTRNGLPASAPEPSGSVATRGIRSLGGQGGAQRGVDGVSRCCSHGPVRRRTRPPSPPQPLPQPPMRPHPRRMSSRCHDAQCAISQWPQRTGCAFCR